MTTYSGSCHCGKVAYDVEGEIDQALECNCSMCARRGGLLWFVPKQAFTLKADDAALGTYRFNTHRIAHHFCTECGIAPFSEASAPDGTPMAAINLRCVEGVELKSLKIVSYDGRAT